jgi:hypothetical protein
MKRSPGSLVLLCLGVFAFYVLSTGPVAWATNDGYHDAYLPAEVNVIYLPLTPLLKIVWIERAFYFYTVILWEGFPAGHTTL